MKPLKKGDRIIYTITEQNGWSLEQTFEVLEDCERHAHSTKVKLVETEICFVGGHEQDQWPKVSYDVERLGEPDTCEACKRYNEDRYRNVRCREHQLL